MRQHHSQTSTDEQYNNLQLDERFDLIPEDTPRGELPEEKDMVLLCRIEGCNQEKRVDGPFAVAETGWTEWELDVAITEDGDTLHPAFCPAHSLDEEQTKNPSSIQPTDIGEDSIYSEMQLELQRQPKFAKFDFTDAPIESVRDSILVCRHDNCQHQIEIEGYKEDFEETDWLPIGTVGILSTGKTVMEAYCPEHKTELYSEQQGDTVIYHI